MKQQESGKTQSYSKYLNSILKGNRSESFKIINECLLSEPNVLNIYEDILKESLYKIGELWEYNKISVADEHMATAVTESVLNEIYPKILPNKSVNKSVVVTSLEHEHHKIGARMVADVFDHSGWLTHFLGSNIPGKDLLKFIEKNKPDLVAISVSIYSHLPFLNQLINTINRRFPRLDVIVGGQAFKHGNTDMFIENDKVTYIPDLHSLQIFIEHKK